MLVLSSVEETAPMCIAEAMAAGLPVVASNIAGIPHMVRNKETGFLFEVGDAESLADYIRRLVTTPGLRDQMGKRGKEIAVNRWKKRIIAEKTLDVYQRILRNHN